MSTLLINQKFYKKLSEDNNTIRVLKLYGFKDSDDFISKIIAFLNGKYQFLNITDFSFLDDEESSLYSMYNGYVKGTFADYDEVMVSFSDIYTKEGNTIISQQLMPVLQKKIEKNIKYLYDKRVKRIFLLTSHKSTQFDSSKNSIKEDSYGSTLQMLVKCLNTLNFDVHQIIPVLNLNCSSKYNSVNELIDNIDYISEQNTGNERHKQIAINDNIIIGSFKTKPTGQDEKYFALKYLTAIFLNDHYKYDVSQPYAVSNKTSQMETLFNLAHYVTVNDIVVNHDMPLSEEEMINLITEEEKIQNQLAKLADKYGIKGTRNVTVNVRLSEVQDALRNRLIHKHGSKCLICNIQLPELLIASHIRDASECDIYGKADLENAFLLCAIHDKLFDKFLISFSFIDGKIMISSKLSEEEIKLCNLDESFTLPESLMTTKRIEYLMWHNEEFEKRNEV